MLLSTTNGRLRNAGSLFDIPIGTGCRTTRPTAVGFLFQVGTKTLAAGMGLPFPIRCARNLSEVRTSFTFVILGFFLRDLR